MVDEKPEKFFDQRRVGQFFGSLINGLEGDNGDTFVHVVDAQDLRVAGGAAREQVPAG